MLDTEKLFKPAIYVPEDNLVPKFCEIESKFQIPEKELLDASYSMCLQTFGDRLKAKSMRQERTFTTEYLDTHNDFFQKKKTSFRRRKIDDTTVQYGIKGLKVERQGLVIRLEDEIKVPNNQDFSSFKFTAPKAIAIYDEFVNQYKDLIDAALFVDFTTLVTRRSFEIVLDGITLDLVFDELLYLHPNNNEAICDPLYETEIEYISGSLKLTDIKAAFKEVESVIADVCDDHKQFKPLISSKAERGYMALKYYKQYTSTT